MERKLATIRKIIDIQPIDGADAIEVATVDGWKVVIKKGEFKVGDFSIYFEIDCWIPHEIAPFLTRGGSEPKVYNGIPGQRLKTIKLRGVTSQGLLLQTNQFLTVYNWLKDDTEVVLDHVKETGGFHGLDVTELLGIQKWEAPISKNLAGVVKGYFPHYIRKTDQDRAQNLTNEIFQDHYHEQFEVTMKLDGSSMTVFYKNDEEELIGVCSRNLRLKLEQEGNAFVDTAKKCGILDALKELGMDIAVQGELMGPGIQGNRENLTDYEFYVFDIFDIGLQKYVNPRDRETFIKYFKKCGASVHHVPDVVGSFTSLEKLGITNIAELLKFADGSSLRNHIREGLVFKSVDSPFTFKSISNEFLLKDKS